MESHYTQQELHEIKKIKWFNYTAFGIVLLLVITAVAWWGHFQYWHYFTQKKWQDYPEKRVNMTADLFRHYNLIGMTEEDILNLLGTSDRNQDKKIIYNLGCRRTLVDREWLIVHLEDGRVKEYSIRID